MYPAIWPSRALDAAQKDVLFTSPTGEFIQVTIQDNANRLTAADWYVTQSPAVDRASLTSVVVDGKTGVLSPDELNVYIVDGSRIIVVTYNPGTKTEISFPTTFKYMYQTMQITTPTALNTNAAANANTNLNVSTTNGNTNTNTNQTTNGNTNAN